MVKFQPLFVAIIPPLYLPQLLKQWHSGKALSICQDMGLSHVIFEGDCMQVIQAMHRKKIWDDILSPIIFYILHLLNCNLCWTVVYDSRGANNSVHYLAKLACNLNIDSVWIEECPEDILPVVLADKLCSVSIWRNENHILCFKKEKHSWIEIYMQGKRMQTPLDTDVAMTGVIVLSLHTMYSQFV